MRLTPELNEELPKILDLVNAGISIRDVAIKLSMPTSKVAKVIKNLPELISQMERTN